jgi:sporulation protein YlmC with PRC-barrel domain
MENTMTRHAWNHTMLFALCLLLAGAAAAQQPGTGKAPDAKAPDTKPPATAPSTTPPPAAAVPVAGEAMLGVTVVQAKMLATGWRASRLIGSDVYNDKNEKVGKIDDLILAPDGKLSVAVVNVGGLIGITNHRVAIPVDQFKTLTPKRATLPGASKEELKKLPEFKFTQ